MFETTCKFNRIQFTRLFYEFVVVETKQIVSSNSNIILTRQTCGQRSGMAAACKHRALAFYFSTRICYKFLVSKRGDESDPGLCMTSGLAKRIPLCSADFQRILRPNTFRHCTAAFALQVPKSCIDLDQTHLHLLMLGTYSKFVRKNKLLAHGVCMPQLCPSAGRRFAVSRSRLSCY